VWHYAWTTAAGEWTADTDRDISRTEIHAEDRRPEPPAVPSRLLHPAHSPLLQILISLHLAARGIGALHHAAAAVREGRCYLFPARSGTGKSTLATLLHRSELFRVLGDDRIFTRQHGSEFAGYGTPWVSTARLCENLSAPLGAIVFLNQAPHTRLEPIARAEAVRRMLPVTDIPWWEPQITDSLLGYLDGLVSTVPAFVLHFAPTPDVAGVLAGALP